MTDKMMIRRIITAEVKEVEGEARVLEFTGSDETQDRMDEIIRADGWKLKDYKKNPVFQWVHDYRLPPIGKSLRTWIDRDEKKLKFRIEFAGPDIKYPSNMPSAETIYQLYKGGYLHAVSVGFIPIESEEGEGVDEAYGTPTKKPRKIYLKQDLLELSAVPVPANPNALENARDAELITAREMENVKDWIHKSELALEGDDPLGEEKPYPNEHACRLRDPKDFQSGSFRRTKREHEGKEYSVIMGRLKDEETMTDQAFRYNKATWTPKEAGKHCRDHKGKFEPASEETMPEARALSQGEIADELDYLKEAVEECGMNGDTRAAAWNLVREIMRLSGDDIPVDIQDKVGAVLNKKNKEKLADIQRLAQEVLDSAEQPDDEEEAKEPPPKVEEVWTKDDTKEVVSKSIRRAQGKLD